MPINSEVPWQPTDSKLFDRGENIGLPPEEYLTWTSSGFNVLEVGTGTNASALQGLLRDNVNVIGIEPGMNYTGGGDRYKNLRTDPQLSSRIAALKAVDAIDHPKMPQEGVDVIFAQNVNFAQYASSKADFFAQLHGLVRCLRNHSEHSYITFESLSDDLIFQIRDEETESINLAKILDDINARWTTRVNKYGITYIVIYRMGKDHQDISDKLLQYIRT